MLFALAALPAAAMAAPTPGVSDQAAANATNDTTGLSDASSVTPVNVCSAPGPGRATCLSQVLATRHSLRYAIHPRLKRASSPNRLERKRARAGTSATPQAVAAATAPQAGTPAYLQQAYDLSYLSQTYGSDKTVAVVVAYDDPNAESDLAVYRARFGLPPCTSQNGCFKKIEPDNPQTTTAARLNHWRFETSLDLQAISALCPKCHITLAEANSDLSFDLATAQVNVGSMTPKPDVISDSFGAQADNPAAAFDFGQAGWWVSTGVATVVASGDSGYLDDGSKEYPAALGGITAAGGTSLAPASGPRGFGESGWSNAYGSTGSGCNTDSTTVKPPWQASIACAGRAYSDISAVGDPTTGIQMYDSSPLQGDSDPAGWVVGGGTSLSAPLVAAYYALVESAQADASSTIQTSEWPYHHTTQLNDPTTGSTGACPELSLICNGMPGYDGPTGAGSISGAAVLGAPGIGGPGPTGNYWRSSSSTTAQLQGGVYPNGRSTKYWWQYGTTTSYGKSTVPVGIGAGTAPVTVAGALTGLAASTTYHYRLVASNSSGTLYGYDFTFKTAAAPTPTGNGFGGTTPPTGGGSSSNPGGSSNPVATSNPVASPKPAGGGSTAPVTPVKRPTAPTIGKPGIAALGGSSATATASITPFGNRTSYYLAYGTSAKLGRRTRTGSTTSTRTARWRLRGLKPGKVYYLQVVATNGGGSRRSSMIRVRTSPVRLGKIKRSGSRLAVSLRCIGSSACRGRLTARAGGHTVAAGRFKVRGNRRATVQLRLNRTAAARASHSKPVRGTLAAVSSYNGHAATVSAKFRLS